MDTSQILPEMGALNITKSNTIYKSLDPSKLEIRLLRICPPTTETETETIRCIQETVLLTPFLFFRALSYEWGPPDDPKYHDVSNDCVVVNGEIVKTTPNLRLALRHLKHNAWYWIDALCINQNDPNERGHQVGMMTRIFEQAFAIDVWLGSHAKDSHLAMDLLHELDGLDDLVVAGSAGYGLSLERKYGKGVKWVKSKLLDPRYGTRWDALQHLMRRSYWSRLWIIQEVVVTPCAERVQLLCGNSQTLFKNLHTLIELVYVISYSVPVFAPKGSMPALVQELKSAGNRVMVLCDHATGWQAMKMGEGNRHDTDILRLLTDYRSQLCSDPRDKVYALLGVSIQYKEHDLSITYASSVEQVYKNTAKYVIEGSGALDILLYARKKANTNPASVPSWVPDWRYYDPFNRSIRDKMKGWKASGSLSAITTISTDGKVLVTKGFILGRVEDLSKRCQISRSMLPTKMGIGNGKIYLRECLSYFVDAIGVAPIEVGKAPSESILKAFYRTIISTTYRRKTCESLWTLEKFNRMCKSLYTTLSEDETDTADWTSSNLPDLLKKITNKGLCKITLHGSPPAVLAEKQDDENLNLTKTLTQFTAGLCTSSTKVDDEVVVVRACPHPLILRRSGRQYILIDEIYVHEFMDGEATKRFPEVDIELI
jgi:hypothetical protein